MKLLHITPTYLPAVRYGGPIYSVHGLCKALAARGHAVEVLTTSVDGEGDSEVPHDTPMMLDGVSICYLPSKRLRRLYFSPLLATRLWQRLPWADVVHSHACFLFPGLAAARLSAVRERPCVIAPRGMLVPELVSEKSAAAKRAWITLFERGNLARAAAVHFTSLREQQDYARMGLPAQRQWVVPNGLDVATSAAPPPSTTGELLYLGRVNWKKGLDRLIPALVHAPTVRLTVAGNDEEGYTPLLQKLAAAHGVGERVRFVGYADAAQKAALLRETSLLALPSRSENFGNVILEAWSAARPVLVTPEVGLSDAVSEADGGVVVTGEAEAIGARLRALFATPERLITQGLNGYHHARAHFSWDVIAATMEARYIELLPARS